MDYRGMSLTQAKRLEMESQVKALELEKELEMERTRLAELRKVHYHLAGASEGWEEVSQEDSQFLLQCTKLFVVHEVYIAVVFVTHEFLHCRVSFCVLQEIRET